VLRFGAEVLIEAFVGAPEDLTFASAKLETAIHECVRSAGAHRKTSAPAVRTSLEAFA